MIEVDLAIVGAGPAGLCAAIEASKYGLSTLILDENNAPGGQLFKQIHKFFGSKQQMSGTRGFEIGLKLLDLAEKNNVEISLESQVIGIEQNDTLIVVKNNKCFKVKAKKIILCCGATEKPLAFSGWTLPGVMGAGAAQTMVNLHRVIPGKNILMVGSGNVGLIVTYHLLQAGAKVEGIVDISNTIKGYGVHAAKIRRLGVPIMLGYTVNRALGNTTVEQVELVQVDADFNKIEYSKMVLNVDTICLAVGLSPSTELARMTGCKIIYNSKLGGFIPSVNDKMQTSIETIYAAGDLTGIEEASIAMEEGKLAGFSCAVDLGCISDKEYEKKRLSDIKRSLSSLRNLN